MVRHYTTHKNLNPCPCCGYRVFSFLGACECCPICKWEDCEDQLKDPFLVCAPNWINLYDAQKNFITTGVSQPKRAAQANIPTSTDVRDEFWRPIHTADDFGTQSRRAKLDLRKLDYKRLYYWSRDFWNNKATYQKT